jgi:hypothetical protein
MRQYYLFLFFIFLPLFVNSVFFGYGNYIIEKNNVTNIGNTSFELVDLSAEAAAFRIFEGNQTISPLSIVGVNESTRLFGATVVVHWINGSTANVSFLNASNFSSNASSNESTPPENESKNIFTVAQEFVSVVAGGVVNVFRVFTVSENQTNATIRIESTANRTLCRIVVREHVPKAIFANKTELEKFNFTSNPKPFVIEDKTKNLVIVWIFKKLDTNEVRVVNYSVRKALPPALLRDFIPTEVSSENPDCIVEEEHAPESGEWIKQGFSILLIAAIILVLLLFAGYYGLRKFMKKKRFGENGF